MERIRGQWYTCPHYPSTSGCLLGILSYTIGNCLGPIYQMIIGFSKGAYFTLAANTFASGLFVLLHKTRWNLGEITEYPIRYVHCLHLSFIWLQNQIPVDSDVHLPVFFGIAAWKAGQSGNSHDASYISLKGVARHKGIHITPHGHTSNQQNWSYDLCLLWKAQ